MFDKFKAKRKSDVQRENHIIIYKHIWNNYVPAVGCSKCLQGELLRQYEKLRWEAEHNGNINWNSSFELFCDFINQNLSGSDALTSNEQEQLKKDLLRIKDSGDYAVKFHEGKIPDEELDVDKIAVIDDQLYDRIEKCIIKFYLKYKEPIQYKPIDMLSE